MTNKEYEVLTNIIGAIESGGQVYGNRRYNAYAGAYTNSNKEVTCTLGWAQNYGYEAMKLCKNIFSKDKNAFRKADTANIESKLSHDWVAEKWNPNTAEKNALISIISTDAGKQCQDELFMELMKKYVADALSFDPTMSVQAQMMWCEIEHLGGLTPTKRIFNRSVKPYSPDTVFASLMKDQNDTSNNNQVGDKVFQTRHECCVKWIKQYVNSVNTSDTTSNTSNAATMTTEQAKEYTRQLLKHYPFVYCPTLASYTNNKTPHKGDVVLFYKNGTYAHTGYVYAVSGSTYYTIEGNTSGGSTVIANGGGVCKKSYSTSSYPGTKFFQPDYGILVRTGMFKTTDDAINAIIATAEAEVGYLEKKSNANLDDKTANAGSANYTKYWRDVYPQYQSLAWCGCFVSWCFQMTIKNGGATSGSSAGSASGSLNETPKSSGIINVAKAPVRTYAAATYSECSFSPLKKGDKLEICDEITNSNNVKWYYIKYNGKYGFVKAKYITETKQEQTQTQKPAQTQSSSTKYTVKVTATALNVRSGPGTQYGITTVIKDQGLYSIVEEQNGWGKLISGAGWISLDYTKRV